MTAVRESIAPLVSGLCFVHCVGLAALGPVLPAAMGLTATARWLEPALWAISATASGAALARARVRRPVALLWGLAVGAGALGVGHDNEALIRVGLGALLVVQIAPALAWWRTRTERCAACQGCAREGDVS